MGVPSRSGDPREHNWDRTPTHSHLNLDPHSPGLPRPCRTPSAFPAAVGTPESTTVTTPHPLPTGTPTRAAWDRPAPGALPARFQPQCPPPRAQLGSPPPPPPEADPRPTPPAFAPPLHCPGTFPASSVHARVGAGCRSMGDVSGT